MDVYTIENKYGSLIIDSGQKPILGYQPFAEYFRQLSGCIYVTEEKLFYCYNPINGLWEKQGQMDMINRISKEILQFARDNDIEDEFASMRRPAVIKEILVYLRMYLIRVCRMKRQPLCIQNKKSLIKLSRMFQENNKLSSWRLTSNLNQLGRKLKRFIVKRQARKISMEFNHHCPHCHLCPHCQLCVCQGVDIAWYLYLQK